MNTLIGIISVPLFILGWLIGFLARPIVAGFSAGFNYLLQAEARRVLEEAQKRFDNE